MLLGKTIVVTGISSGIGARVGRAGSAPPALFLCSDGARWINGANLPVDGGLEASINATVLGF